MVERVQSKRRRIMRSFRIDELSACDRPAQKHALAVLMKRADDEQEYDEMQFEKITRDEPTSFPTLEAAMEHLQKLGMSKLDAMSKAADRHPDLLAKYQHDGERIAKAAAAAATPRPIAKAVRDFEERVTEVMSRDKITKLAALEKAAKEHPAEFEAYQEA
jgi:hypothetical protein